MRLKSAVFGPVLGAFLFVAAAAGAQTVNVWPGVAPGSETWTYVEKVVTGGRDGTIVQNVVTPTLEAFLPAKAKATGTGVIVAPGGGFSSLLIDQEGRDVARWLQQKGIAAFVLKYRLMAAPAGGGMGSMQDMSRAEVFAVADTTQAMTVVRARAAEWGVAADRVGVVGFSAGATLGFRAALSEDAAARPNFVGVIYGGPFGGPGALAPGLPPMFLAWAQDDGIGVGTTAKLYEALTAAKYKPETHAYLTGGHGFGAKKQGKPSDLWIDSFHAWLHAQGLTTAKR